MKESLLRIAGGEVWPGARGLRGPEGALPPGGAVALHEAFT